MPNVELIAIQGGILLPGLLKPSDIEPVFIDASGITNKLTGFPACCYGNLESMSGRKPVTYNVMSLCWRK